MSRRTSDAHMTLYGVAVIGFGGRCEGCDTPWDVHFHSALEKVLCGVDSKDLRMEQRELRHDRHTVSLLTDHMVITPKYRGKILVGDVALAVEGIIRTTCKEMKIEIIDMAVNIDHVHLFIEYPPKYSVSFIAKKIKGRSSRILRQNFPHLKEWCKDHLWAPGCYHGSVGHGWEVVEKYIGTQDYARKDKSLCTSPVLKCGV